MLIYFVEKSIPFNSNDLNSNFIGGTEKVLINISNELAKINGIKVFSWEKIFRETNKIKFKKNLALFFIRLFELKERNN